jgi:hypothetical protein
MSSMPDQSKSKPPPDEHCPKCGREPVYFLHQCRGDPDKGTQYKTGCRIHDDQCEYCQHIAKPE